MLKDKVDKKRSYEKINVLKEKVGKIGDVRKRECERRMLVVRSAVKKKGLLQRNVGNWGSRKEERVLEEKVGKRRS